MRLADLYITTPPNMPMPSKGEKIEELKRLFRAARVESDPFQFVRDHHYTYVGTRELIQIWYRAHHGEQFPWIE